MLRGEEVETTMCDRMQAEHELRDTITNAHRILDEGGVLMGPLPVRITSLLEEREQAQRDANQAIADVQRYAARAEAAEKRVTIELDVSAESGRRRLYVEKLLTVILEHGWPKGTTGPACVREAWAWLRHGPKSEAFKAWMSRQGYGPLSDRSEKVDLAPGEAIARIRRAAHRREGVDALTSIRVDEGGYRVSYEQVYADGTKSDPLTLRAPTLRALAEAVEAQEAARNEEEKQGTVDLHGGKA